MWLAGNSRPLRVNKLPDVNIKCKSNQPLSTLIDYIFLLVIACVILWNRSAAISTRSKCAWRLGKRWSCWTWRTYTSPCMTPSISTMSCSVMTSLSTWGSAHTGSSAECIPTSGSYIRNVLSHTANEMLCNVGVITWDGHAAILCKTCECTVV